MNLRDIDFPSSDEPLRQDVGLLGDLVGEVIREQGGDRLFECVETARHAAIRRREGVEGAGGQVEAALQDLSATEAAEVVRAFSTYFQVVNLAERVHRIRRGRDRAREGGVPQEGSLADAVQRLKALGVDGDGLLDLFASSRVEPVFTAHPSESTRRIILEKQERIARELIARLDPTRTPHQERVSLARIRENVTASWQTEEHPSVRPTVSDEREHVLYYVAHVLFDVLPARHERLDDALRGCGVQDVGDGPALVRIGSWVGGDMDGNPNVDAGTVRATLQRHRDLALGAYAREIEKLARHLSQSAARVGWSDRVSRMIERYAAWFPDAVSSVSARHAGMGYRALLKLIGARLRATRAEAQHGYAGPDEFLADVTAIAESLERNRGAHAGLFGVRRLLRRVRAFGFHMAVLDVRQDARELRDVMAELLDDRSWPARSSKERAQRLGEMLTEGKDGRGIGTGSSNERVAKAMDVFTAIAESRSEHGPDAIGPYIISMAQDVDDVLTVMWLAGLAGLGLSDELPLDVAPLFETVTDLERAPEVLERLFSHPIVGPHLSRRGGRQIVMVGYSDSNKDGGIASARWALQRALQGMARVAADQAVTLTVFHGRGHS